VLIQSSLLSDRPGSLVGGVRNCEELPKLDNCFSGSLWLLGFRLKKLIIFPVVVFLPGLGQVGEVVVESVFGGGKESGIASFSGARPSISPFRMLRVCLLELICRHQLESREPSERVALLSALSLLWASHC
jgi:hypothetical protein